MVLAMSRREVIGAEVAVRHAVAGHVVARAEHGGRNGEDGFLGAAPGFEAEELGLEVRALRPYGGPGGRTPRFEPSSARWPATTSGGARRASTVNSSSSASSSARPPCRLSSPVVGSGGWRGTCPSLRGRLGRAAAIDFFVVPRASRLLRVSLISDLVVDKVLIAGRATGCCCPVVHTTAS
jgi:hypothetical protein